MAIPCEQRASIPKQTLNPELDVLTRLSGMTAATLQQLGKLGIVRLQDLWFHLPLRYDDETRRYTIASAPLGQPVVIEGQTRHAEIQTRTKRQLVVKVEDVTGQLQVRFLNFYPAQLKQWEVGKSVRLFGVLRASFAGVEMLHPKTCFSDVSQPLNTHLTPIYPTLSSLKQEKLQQLIQQALKAVELQDPLPEQWRRQHHLLPLGDSLKLLHRPPPLTDLDSLQQRNHPAWRRIKFDELLAQQLLLLSSRLRRRAVEAPVLSGTGNLSKQLIAQLPFSLTTAQCRAIDEINRDLSRPVPMQRLLQGDVGSGKTIVAAIAALQAVENQTQAAFMVPTELLAEQHYDKLKTWLAPLGVRIAQLTRQQKKKAREEVATALSVGACDIVVGTQALFQQPVQFQKLSLIIVDEQQRFGVSQRLQLREKGSTMSHAPHQLMMSATPIPRTLAMSYFADLDVSIIDELPAGRLPVKTTLLSETRRGALIERLAVACRGSAEAAPAQAYWVCPLIEESDTLQLQTAIATHAELSALLPDLKIGLIHGRMAAPEKRVVMHAFNKHELDILVATTVVEVGVDVPNATRMVIENAERMGLAQLHQLRGRVGRSEQQSYCVLLYAANLTEHARARLEAMRATTDGFLLAKEDLRLRGPGELLGHRQSGAPLLRFADLNADLSLLERARTLAPQLLQQAPQAVEQYFDCWFGNQLEQVEI